MRKAKRPARYNTAVKSDMAYHRHARHSEYVAKKVKKKMDAFTSSTTRKGVTVSVGPMAVAGERAMGDGALSGDEGGRGSPFTC